MKEAVVLNLDSITNASPYRDYYRGRNGTVAADIARYMGVPYFDDATPHDMSPERTYQVMPHPITEAGSEYFGISSETDFYGSVVEHLDHVGKSILHRTESSRIPGFYSHEFATAVRDLVLPGTTGFSADDITAAYDAADTQRYAMRLKLPDLSNGLGQTRIHDRRHLAEVLKDISPEEIAKHGLVIEANVIDPRTISVGYAVLGEDMFSFIADQKDETDDSGRTRYLGADVTVVRGTLEQLEDLMREDRRKGAAVHDCLQFLHAYSRFNPIASRLSFDRISGTDARGEALHGITDITARVGGTCPAIMMAAERCSEDSGAFMIRSEVNLNYQPKICLPCEEGATTYIDHPTLRLTARVISES